MTHQENLRVLLGINWHSYYHLGFELNVTEAAHIPGLAVVTSRWVLLNGTQLLLMSGRLYRQCLNLFLHKVKACVLLHNKIVTIFRNICTEMDILKDSHYVLDTICWWRCQLQDRVLGSSRADEFLQYKNIRNFQNYIKVTKASISYLNV